MKLYMKEEKIKEEVVVGPRISMLQVRVGGLDKHQKLLWSVVWFRKWQKKILGHLDTNTIQEILDSKGIKN